MEKLNMYVFDLGERKIIANREGIINKNATDEIVDEARKKHSRVFNIIIDENMIENNNENEIIFKCIALTEKYSI